MTFINYLSRIHFDFGAVERLPGVLAAEGITAPLVVTDQGVRAAGIVDTVLAALAPMGLPGQPPVYDGTPLNPTEEAVMAALAIYREAGCDGLVSVGGGAAIDLAKGVALPTTAGTGAEVGRAAALCFRDGHKSACVSLELIPRAVICDPELTLSLPPLMTAATGMDALCHGIETWLSNRDNPPAGSIALGCVGRVSRSIERAVAAATEGKSGDREVRSEMLMGALEGGLAMQKGLGAVHAMSHALEDLGLHHGTLNAVLLPAVLRFNQSHAGERYAELRRVIGLDEGADLADWAAGLGARIGLPAGLAEMGVEANTLPAFAAAAAKTPLSLTNPRPATAADYEAMLEDSMG